MRAENFHRLVLSMKSSDTAVMIEATRTLVKMMNDGGYYYPIHLGVTEAGEGEDGRIRSAAGIGALLAEGTGDTVRVSLSEDPELEIPVARTLVSYFTRGEAALRPDFTDIKAPARSPGPVNNIRGPLVLANLSHHVVLTPASYFEAGFTEDKETGSIAGGDGSADIVLASYCPEVIPEQVRLAVPYRIWLSNRERKNLFPVFSPETYYENRVRSETMNLVLTGPHLNEKYLAKVGSADSVLIFTFNGETEKYAPEKLFRSLATVNPALCVILNPVYAEDSQEELNIKSSALLGRFLTDRSVRGICVSNRGGAGTQGLTKLAFSILQATETRITRTMYLSCPTCGRTKFNLQEAVKKVKTKTSHLKGLKIAVMGCIVNGPGEMAGADWGYVGAGDGKVHIYKGLVAVLKNIPEEKAADELLRLIAEENG
jgi:(E)-4-hydroxy-3-methylbut-2-enyl-diphosphate synthase